MAGHDNKARKRWKRELEKAGMEVRVTKNNHLFVLNVNTGDTFSLPSELGCWRTRRNCEASLKRNGLTIKL